MARLAHPLRARAGGLPLLSTGRAAPKLSPSASSSGGGGAPRGCSGGDAGGRPQEVEANRRGELRRREIDGELGDASVRWERAASSSVLLARQLPSALMGPRHVGR